MPPVIGIPIAGAMGAGIGARLVQHGLTVRTITTGRSEATLARVGAAGIESTDKAGLCAADIILAITPPGIALTTAQDLAPALASTSPQPVYAECNAINPETAKRIGEIVIGTGAGFADGGIIGQPPAEGHSGPVLYVSGQAADRVAVLRDYGLDVRALDGGVGAASALKMCYGGLTKGLLGLGAALILAAGRAGVADALRSELEDSQKLLFERLDRMMPDAYPKAYRWVTEMQEIADFLGDGRSESGVYYGLSGLFERLAVDWEGKGEEIAAIAAFLRHPAPAA